MPDASTYRMRSGFVALATMVIVSAPVDSALEVRVTEKRAIMRSRR